MKLTELLTPRSRLQKLSPAHDSVVAAHDHDAATGSLHSVRREEGKVLRLKGVLCERDCISFT